MKLELRAITKRFGSFAANDSIDLTVEPGEILGLLGENGAGKSTLMNVLYGLYQPDEGEIVVDGHPVSFHSPGDAIAAGIGMVHQHFMLIPVFTVAENVALGRESSRFGFLNSRRARKDVAEISARYGLQVAPDALVSELPVGVQQRVEIVKALTGKARVLILDEPTAVLTPQETDDLMQVMRNLSDAGTSIVFITHKLREVREVCDRIAVIRRGKVVGQVSPDSTPAELANLMVGHEVNLSVAKNPATLGSVALSTTDLRVIDPSGQVVLDNVSLDIHGGEIYGIAGVQGNGQTELAEALMGLATVASGSVRLHGEDITGESVAKILRRGVGYVPEDRMHDGLVGTLPIAENLILDLYHQPPFGKGLSLNVKAVADNAQDRVAEFDVRAQSTMDPVSSLSGGNQQKVVLAREMSRKLRLLIVAQPTRGLDVGSMEFVHRRIVAERDAGAAVLVISTELDEIRGLSDRIGVMYRGKIIGELTPDASPEAFGLLMAGDTSGNDGDRTDGERADGGGGERDQARNGKPAMTKAKGSR